MQYSCYNDYKAARQARARAFYADLIRFAAGVVFSFLFGVLLAW